MLILVFKNIYLPVLWPTFFTPNVKLQDWTFQKILEETAPFGISLICCYCSIISFAAPGFFSCFFFVFFFWFLGTACSNDFVLCHNYQEANWLHNVDTGSKQVSIEPFKMALLCPKHEDDSTGRKRSITEGTLISIWD